MSTNNLQSSPLDLNENNEPVPNLSPIEIQQEYFENLPDCDWVKYDMSNRKYLMQNVAFALFGSPSTEGDLFETSDSEQADLEGYTSRQRERVLNVFKNICNQSKYSQNDADIFLSILLIVCAKPKPLKFFKITPSDYWVDLHKKTDIDMWCTAVFKVRKCIPSAAVSKSCRVYIDDTGRVYQSWQSYLKNNTLPKCVMVAPEGGEYQGVIVEGEEAFVVKLTVTPSPALGLKSRVLGSADTAGAVASLGAVGVLGAAVFTPVGPVLLVGATVATVATGLYGLVRSSQHLHDRRVHEQSISLRDPEARGSWLNIGASGVGLAAGAAGAMLARSAAAGTNLTRAGQALTVSVEVLRRANLVTGGAGVLHSLAHMIHKYRKHGERASKLELFQFAAAVLFFSQAAVSGRTARAIVEDAQAAALGEYRAALRSNRHRKIFDKISAESRRVAGSAVQGNTEVICGIKHIANKDQYFADVLRINRDLNRHQLRVSMTADGRVNLNAAHSFHPGELAAIQGDGRARLFAALGPADRSAPDVPTGLRPAAGPGPAGQMDEHAAPVGVRPEEVLRVGAYLVRVGASGAESIATLLQDVSRDVHDGLITVAMNVISSLVPGDITKLKLLNSDEDLLQQTVNFVFNYLKRARPMGDACRESDSGIVLVLKEFFQDGVVRQDTLLFLKDKFLQWVDEELDKRRQQFPDKRQVECAECGGVRFA